MRKAELLGVVCEKIESDLVALRAASAASAEAATGPESRAENQYDTRSVEASYLAGAQAKRVAELEEVLVTCRLLTPRDFSETDPILVTALVELELSGPSLKRSWVLLLPKGAGMGLTWNQVAIQTISTASPLGESLLGLCAGDSLEVDQGGVSREYKI